MTNTSGFGEGRGYQAGIDDVGNGDEITNNTTRFGLDGFVTRLRSLNEAQQFLTASIPLVASIGRTNAGVSCSA